MKFYKRLSLLLSMGIMGIGLITFCIRGPQALADDTVTEVQNMVQTAQTLEPTPTEEVEAPTPTPTPTPEPNKLEREAVPGIHELVQKYLEAKLVCTTEAFEGIISEPSLIDLDDLQKRTEAVLKYNDLVCYTKRGTGDIDYVVYYTYSMDIATLESQVLAIDSVYVYATEDGSFRIFMGELPHATTVALAELSQEDDVMALVEETYKLMEAAMEKDPQLVEFWARIYDEEP